MIEVLRAQGIAAGIKVDAGTKDLYSGIPGEVCTPAGRSVPENHRV